MHQLHCELLKRADLVLSCLYLEFGVLSLKHLVLRNCSCLEQPRGKSLGPINSAHRLSSIAEAIHAGWCRRHLQAAADLQ
jgi:hypothetical protein